jgi:glycosyltransferase involved in cell wall biosynthesis
VPNELLPSLYNAAAVFVIAGTAELQCIVAMEAMASGLPILGARAVALPELIHHTKNGYLFEPGDYLTLADYITVLLQDRELRKRMGVESLRIIAEHDSNNTLEAFEDLYRKAQSVI